MPRKLSYLCFGEGKVIVKENDIYRMSHMLQTNQEVIYLHYLINPEKSFVNLIILFLFHKCRKWIDLIDSLTTSTTELVSAGAYLRI